MKMGYLCVRRFWSSGERESIGVEECGKKKRSKKKLFNNILMVCITK